MHCCEFCLSEYHTRPQVKNPRACQKLECQRKRQRSNEQDWHERHSEFQATEYHTIRRRQRKQRIRAVVKVLQRCLQVGADLLGVPLGTAEISRILMEVLLDLGVRRINKFWHFEKTCNEADFDVGLNPI